MNRLFGLLVLIIFFTGCSEDEPVAGQFVFGVAYGFCAGDCAHFYQIKDGKLFEDDMDTYINYGLKFHNTPLSEEEYEKAVKLIDIFPQYLSNNPDTTIGCPDCADQGGYHIVRVQGGITQFWHIDTSVDSQPDEIQSYMEVLKITLDELK